MEKSQTRAIGDAMAMLAKSAMSRGLILPVCILHLGKRTLQYSLNSITLHGNGYGRRGHFVAVVVLKVRAVRAVKERQRYWMSFSFFLSLTISQCAKYVSGIRYKGGKYRYACCYFFLCSPADFVAPFVDLLS